VNSGGRVTVRSTGETVRLDDAAGGCSSSGSRYLLLAGTVFGYVRVKLEGPDLADKIATVLNQRMRGRIEIGAVEWPTGALKTVVSGGWVPVVVRDVKVWDDCVLSADVAEGDPDQLRVGNPNDDCTPDDSPRSQPDLEAQASKVATQSTSAHGRDRHPRPDVRAPRLRVP